LQACVTALAQQGSQKGAPSAALPVSSTSGVCMATCKLLKAWQQHPMCLRTQGGGESYPSMCMISLAPLECGLTSMYANRAVTAVLQQMQEMYWTSAFEHFLGWKELPVEVLSREHKLYNVLSCSTACGICVVARWAISRL